MSTRTARARSLLATQTDTYWDALNDSQLLAVTWATDSPEDLPNLNPNIPDDLGPFIIEMSYDLDSERVRCGHCVGHQRHKHGFVLRAQDGRRYLLGSICGPKYGADYEVASEARRRAHRRAIALHSQAVTRAALPDLIDAVTEANRSATMALFRRTRGAIRQNAPRVIQALERQRAASVGSGLQLATTTRARNLAEEKRRQLKWFEEASKIGELNLSNREHSRRLRELSAQHKSGEEIWEEHAKIYGYLPNSDWLLLAEDPSAALVRMIATLRAFETSLGTPGLATGAIETKVRHVKLVLERADAAISASYGVQDFLQAKHLDVLSAWLDDQLHLDVRISRTSDSYRLTVGGTTHRLTTVAQIVPSPFAAVYRRWLLTKAEHGQPA